MPNRAITARLGKISAESIGRNESFLVRQLNIQSRFIFEKTRTHISGRSVLDVGTGIGGFAAYLRYQGFDVESIDVVDSSCFREFPTALYDGMHLPYSDGKFETAVLIHVLHHCADRMQVLREALRVASVVIVIEDTYRNRLEWLAGSLSDMLGNGEYYFHKYSTREEWRQILKEEGCRILHEESYSRFTYRALYGRYVMFVIEKPQP
jgi:ubiquinone/menaquinone biosynthesis C-methylase UbiE